jgi:hypothetical protein
MAEDVVAAMDSDKFFRLGSLVRYKNEDTIHAEAASSKIKPSISVPDLQTGSQMVKHNTKHHALRETRSGED